ncbi:MAG: hypothetical protein AAB817_02805 [Patescibacteria group bacterium]
MENAPSQSPLLTPPGPKNYAGWILVALVVIIVAIFAWWLSQSPAKPDNTVNDQLTSQTMPAPGLTVNGEQPVQPVVTNEAGLPTDPTPANNGAAVGEVKSFTMTSFYELVDGQPKPQFSVREIAVKKGDKVRIVVTNTKGGHDFNLDEFNVHVVTPLNQEVVVEFTADQVGDFVYYCNTPGHRALGHWGTLKVTE